MERTEPAVPTQATLLLQKLAEGEQEAAEQLLPLVYDELRGMAAGYVGRQPPGHTLQPTALVHEAFLKLIHQPEHRSRAHFMAVAATAMRQILTDHARAKRTAKRGEAWQRVSLDQAASPGSWSEVDIVELDDVLDELARLDERHARIVQLRFFGGLTTKEAAEVLGISRATVDNDWRVARAWLSAQLSGRDER